MHQVAGLFHRQLPMKRWPPEKARWCCECQQLGCPDCNKQCAGAKKSVACNACKEGLSVAEWCDAEISQTLELCCAAVVVDRTGLGLGVSHRDRVARPSPRSAVGGHPAVMVDASPHGGVVLEHVARVLLGHARQGRGRALARARRDHGKMPRADAVAIDRRRLQVFLDGRVEAVDLIDEEDVSLLQVGQDPGKVAGFFDLGP